MNSPQVGTGITAPIGVGWTNDTSIPAMASFHTPTSLPGPAVNFVTQWSTFMASPATFVGNTATASYFDDLAGLTKLYPVLQINNTTGKRPLINDFAAIQGQCADSSGNPVFGRNVYILPHTYGSSQVPTAGGAVRQPTNGAVSGTARLGITSIVGRKDPVVGRPTTGEFEITAIPAIPTSGTGITSWDIGAGPLESTGFNFGAGTSQLAEWWSDPTINPAYNIPLTFSPQEGMGSDESLPIALGSLVTIPGTIITLVQPITVGTSGLLLQSRPVIDITTRTLVGGGLPTGLTINVHHNTPFPIGNVKNVSCTFNGVTTTVAQASANGASSLPGTLGGVLMSTYSVTIPTGSTRPFVVDFFAFETSSPAGTTAVQGQGRVIF